MNGTPEVVHRSMFTHLSAGVKFNFLKCEYLLATDRFKVDMAQRSIHVNADAEMLTQGLIPLLTCALCLCHQMPAHRVMEKGIARTSTPGSTNWRGLCPWDGVRIVA